MQSVERVKLLESKSLSELSWDEAKAYFEKSDIAIVPVGANEQHGPQNPLGTDFLVADGLAKEVSARTGVLTLPPVPFGVSSHHRQFSGTIAISPPAFKAYMKDVFRSLASYGARKVLVINGHGGNTSALREVARELRESGEMFIVSTEWWHISSELLPKLFPPEERMHAGSEETSVVLSLLPKLSKLKRVNVGSEEPRFSWEKHADLPFDTRDMTPSGVLGRIRTVSAERGKQVVEAVVTELCKIAEDLRSTPWEELKPKQIEQGSQR